MCALHHYSVCPRCRWSVGLWICTMYSLLQGQSGGMLCAVFLPGGLPSTGVQCSPLPLHDERGAWWALLFISNSLWSGCCSGWPTAFLIWWWAVKWPARLHNWAAGTRVGFQGFPYPGSLSGWMNDTVHTPQACHTQTYTDIANLSSSCVAPQGDQNSSFPSAPCHCPGQSPCPWVSWDARNNWWWCRSWYLSVQGSRHFLPPPAEGYCPATSIFSNYFELIAKFYQDN